MTMAQREREIHALIADWTDAICKGDIQRVLKDRTDDIVMYDVPKPIQSIGIAAYEASWKLFFDHNPPGLDCFSFRDIQIVAGEDVAYAFGLLIIGGGDAQCRLTLGLRRVDGAWKVTHEHHSMPILPG
ncbi:nuclear transport factor 2 family protein [Paracoccus sp. KR1-242]|uniref:nuclear transport factor 2 family protein n=1 Tax=Paracoccus sp. KR1-242 TaxID=3410028 RepID=UPI003C037BB6